jgi:hypothetical protein
MQWISLRVYQHRGRESKWQSERAWERAHYGEEGWSRGSKSRFLLQWHTHSIKSVVRPIRTNGQEHIEQLASTWHLHSLGRSDPGCHLLHMSLTQAQQKEQESRGHSPLLHWVLVEGHGPLRPRSVLQSRPSLNDSNWDLAGLCTEQQEWGSGLAWQSRATREWHWVSRLQGGPGLHLGHGCLPFSCVPFSLF